MLKDALEYLVSMGQKETMEVKGNTYIVGGNEIRQVMASTQSALETTTLQSIVDYLAADLDGAMSSDSSVIVHIVSPTRVEVFGEVNADKYRDKLLTAKATLPDRFNFDSFYDMESFNIALQSRFVDVQDRAKLLALVGNVKDKSVRTVGDDGVTQTTTIKTGVASVADVLVPNPVTLAPYRTFAEVEQPSSNFVFRMRSGNNEPAAALFEADGGAWRIDAIANIRGWLDSHLADALGSDMQRVTILS